MTRSIRDDNEDDDYRDIGITEDDFAKIVHRIRNTRPIDDTDDEVVAQIKAGRELPFLYYNEPEPGLHFGDFEGAYYGQRYRNNMLGEIDADSLNLRKFHYLTTRLRDGRVIVGTTYHGLYGDYEGLKSCFTHLLGEGAHIRSMTLKNLATEIGDGEPISLNLTYRKRRDRAERRPLFGSTGVLAIKNSDFGEQFPDRVREVAQEIRGNEARRKHVLADIINRGELITLDEDEIIGCTAVVRQDGRTRTIYLLGDPYNFSTKFPMDVPVNRAGETDRRRVLAEMTRIMREKILPLMG